MRPGDRHYSAERQGHMNRHGAATDVNYVPMQKVDRGAPFLAAKRRCPLCRDARLDPYRFGLFACQGCGLVMDRVIFQPGSATALNQEAFDQSYEPETSIWVSRFQLWKGRRYLRNLRQSGIADG